MRGPDDEAANPKYAHLEIERRWLVHPAAVEGLALDQPIAIHDRYIERTRLRLRRMTHGSQTVLKLTRKYECPDPMARPIVTAYLSPEEYEVLAALPALVLEKTRFRARHDGLDYCVDRFAGALAGLWTAEIEMSDLAALRAVDAPPWTLGDITEDARYQGATLARLGLPKE